MKMTRIVPSLALAVFSTAAAAGPSGYEPPPPPQKVYGAGTAVVRAGVSYIHPMSDDVSFVEDFFFDGDAFRANVDPDDEWGWHINGMWMPIDHWGLELNYISGDEHKGGRNRGFFNIDGAEIGRFESRQTQLTVNWYPLDPTCLIQPYIGVGINYTDFDDEKFTLFRNLGPNSQFTRFDGDFSLGHSWGHTWQIGVDWVFGRDSNWLANVSAVYVDAETEMGFQIFRDELVGVAAVEDVVASFSGDYRYNPWTFNLGIGYKFNF